MKVSFRRYALYWFPDEQDPYYTYGYNWLNQNSKFNTILEKELPNLSFYDFSAALYSLKKYGFHSEFFSPFTLNPTISEPDLVDKCLEIAQQVTVFDVKLGLQNRGHTLLLSSYYKNMMVMQLRHLIQTHLYDIIEIDKMNNHLLSGKFQIILSNHCELLLHKDLIKIAHQYWSEPIKSLLPIKGFYLCYQKNKKEPFKKLMKFNFTA